MQVDALCRRSGQLGDLPPDHVQVAVWHADQVLVLRGHGEEDLTGEAALLLLDDHHVRRLAAGDELAIAIHIREPHNESSAATRGSAGVSMPVSPWWAWPS